MTATSPAVGGIGHQKPASLVNSFRLATAAQRLAFYAQAGRLANQFELIEFRSCCIFLAKSIDFAIANNEIPAKARELPLLLKKICRRRSEHHGIYAGIMVMMISVKNACLLGWFQQSDTQEVLALVDEIWNGFGGPGGSSPALEGHGSPFSQIMERFYPFMKLGHTLLSLEAKPGCTILTKDFHISKKMPYSAHQKIRLFVVGTDSIETSACIVNPPEVSFLLNGKAVEKRVNIEMDSGPQLPSNVTRLLKYGTNLLQAMGNFKSHYIIVLAFTDVVLPSETPALEDYVQCGTIVSNSDADLIEGPSRVSLNCPISHTRIKLPVKGQLCKHIQCFDFWNYVNINMRKPSWRCPHCNQPVCYTDIRLDQNMVEVLEKVAYNAADVIISTCGSWKVVTENDDNEEPVRETIHDLEDPTSILNSGLTVFDLTGDDDEIGTFGNAEVEDRKPLLSDIQSQSINANNAALNEASSSGFLISNGLAPDFTMLNQFSAPSNTMLQPPQTLDSAIGQEYANLSLIPRSRDPVAVQALSVPFLQTSSTQDRPATTTSTFSTLLPTSQPSPFLALPVTPVGHYMSGASQVQTSSVQDRPATTTMFSASISTTHSSQVHASFVTPFGHFQGSLIPYYQNPSQEPNMASSQNHPSIQNLRHPMSTLRQPPSPLEHSQAVDGTNFGLQSPYVSSDHISVQAHAHGLSQVDSTAESVSQVSDFVDQTTASSSTYWPPQGRMRGSLVPGSYSMALDPMIIRPTQQSQTTRQVQAPQVQTSQPHPSMASYNLPVDIQELLVNPTQTVRGSSPMAAPPAGFTGPSGMPPGTW